MARPRAWLCWSSGKDGAWALQVAREESDVDVVGLLTTVTQPEDRISMHDVRTELLEAQALAIGLPVHRVSIPAPCPNDVYEDAMLGAVEEAKSQGVSEMVFGDLFLGDVRAYREGQLAGTGLKTRFPLWGRPTDQLAREMIAAGLVAHITCLDARKLPSELAGRRFDEGLLDEFPDDVDPCGEHGEFHTFVSGGPMFTRPICVVPGRVVTRDDFVFADLMPGLST